ncbi:MAG: cellulase family glycosylhydrolase [Alphaproteobacteria bacterium]|nr:cellulase family glycosylhydrolase [Alphaproteobacteria bacterium]MBV9862478.1 cellulase family glycosylhydrolase [Alphaproteobacteria bacterium]
MPSEARLPRWRGFNLLEKFISGTEKPFREQDFDIIARWGFDFVRLPLDYRIWTPQPGQYNELQLKELDQAVEWAGARGIHVDLCLHRAPGYSVAGKIDALDLWAEGAAGDEARRQFAAQWQMLAERYRGIGAERLSFNLVNEPPRMPGARYAAAVTPAVEAIREVSPDRVIIADGMLAANGLTPVPELDPLRLAQSLRAYFPPWLTLAPGLADARRGAAEWPPANQLNAYLYGNQKKEWQHPLAIKVDLPQRTELEIQVAAVSAPTRLVIRANGATVLDQRFDPANDPDTRRKVGQGGDIRALYDRGYTAALPAGALMVTIELAEGDWLTFSRLSLRPFAGRPARDVVPHFARWGEPQRGYVLNREGSLIPEGEQAPYDRADLYRDELAEWGQSAESGHGVMIGEWGVSGRTPHGAMLAWMRDHLAVWKQHGLGWALWHLRGETGPLDSDRPDARYETFEGHRLDRAMLEELQAG